MTEEEQRIAIAKFCGFKPNTVCPECYGSGYSDSDMDHDPCSNCQTLGEIEPYYDSPNYPKDLNAMHEAEKTLNEKQKVFYLQRLTQVRLRSEESGTVACIIDRATFATAAQRAEAFLRTIGKWKD